MKVIMRVGEMWRGEKTKIVKGVEEMMLGWERSGIESVPAEEEVGWIFERQAEVEEANKTSPEMPYDSCD